MYKRINRLWRILATGFCFSAFGIGGLLLSLIILPLQRLLYRNNERRKKAARYTVHLSFKCFVAGMKLLGVLNVSIEGAEQLKNQQGKIIIANHPSLIDVVVLISLIENADCVIKSKLFNNPFIGGVLRSSGYISNSDPDKLIEDCAKSVAMGNNIVIFPEGTRTNSKLPLKLQRGFANIALRSGADLMFISIEVTPSTLTKDNVWYNVPERKFDFIMQVEQDIAIAPFIDEFGDNITKGVRQLTREVEALFKQILSKQN